MGRLERNETLVKQQLVSQTALDTSRAEANALAADNSATSAMAVIRVLKRVSKELFSDCRALLGARVGLKFIFGSSLKLILLLIPCHPDS